MGIHIWVGRLHWYVLGSRHLFVFADKAVQKFARWWGVGGGGGVAGYSGRLILQHILLRYECLFSQP